MSNQWHPETLAVHTGVYKDTTFNSVTTPIYPSSTFYFERVGVTKGYDYSRTSNPTRKALEENLAALEGGAGAWATATGMAAFTTALFLLKSGDRIVAGHDIYGGTWRLLSQLAPRAGIDVTFVNMGDHSAVRAAMRKQTKAVIIETPSNPLLNLVDIAETCRIAHNGGALAIVDNTFMSPYFQRPFEMGADIVIHSTTKYLNGHSDVVGGVVISKTAEMAQQVAYLGNCLGTGCSPFDAWLVLRGLKTLGPRMEAHQRNSVAVAEFLSTHPRVKKVYFPGLATHPHHELARQQMSGWGGMLSFDLDLEAISADDFFKGLKLFLLAESLGGVESLVEQPFTMSHASMTEEARVAAGITPSTIRVSLGIEHPDDLVADLKQALGG